MALHPPKPFPDGRPPIQIVVVGRDHDARALAEHLATASCFVRVAEDVGGPATPTPVPEGRIRSIRRGVRIALRDDEVLTIDRGLVALGVLHDDGTDVLLGLSGANDVVIGHPDDRCCLQLVAHTDVDARIEPWNIAVRDPLFPNRVRARLRAMEAWAAAQARPHLSQRLLGILELLAERFGEPAAGGVRITARLTHAHLAAAIGTTRPTMTRLLASLAHRRRVWQTGTGNAARFCLTRSTHDHVHS
jgi:hypothetical protein